MKYIPFLILAFCLSSLGCKEQENMEISEPIVFGAVYNLTGGQSSLDIPSAKGAQLAVDQINANGGIRNQEVQLSLQDGATDPEKLKAAVSEIINEHPEVVAFLGLSDTDMVLAAAGEAAKTQRTFLTSGATSPQLPDQIPDDLFLACFGDNVQAAAAAEWAYDELQARTVSIVYDSSDTYTRLLQAYFSARFVELGGQITTRQAYAQGNFNAAIPQIQASDFIFFAALPQDAPAGAEAIRQAGFTAPIIGGDAYDEPASWQNLTTLSEVYFTTHAYLGADNPDPRVQAFRDAYVQAYNEAPGAFAALGYDAAGLLAEAVRIAGNAKPESIREALNSIRDFPGVTGMISYDGSRIPRKSVTIMEVKDGVQRLVKEVLPNKVPAP